MQSADSTAQLLERARSGDADAVESLFARYVPPLRRWASGRLPRWARDISDTHDIVQDTVLRTFQGMGRFELRSTGALHAYLRSAVMNRIRDEIRKRQARREPCPLESDIEAPGPSPLEQAIGSQAVERYEQALAVLSEQERSLIIGRIELGMSFDELAEALGKPTCDAARKAAQRALVKLVQEMHHAG